MFFDDPDKLVQMIIKHGIQDFVFTTFLIIFFSISSHIFPWGKGLIFLGLGSLIGLAVIMIWKHTNLIKTEKNYLLWVVILLIIGIPFIRGKNDMFVYPFCYYIGFHTISIMIYSIYLAKATNKIIE